jgi:hypothetical protein
MITALPPPHCSKFLFFGRIGCGAEQEIQRQESGLKLAVVIEKSAIFSMRTDRWVLPSFKEWKFSKPNSLTLVVLILFYRRRFSKA